MTARMFDPGAAQTRPHAIGLRQHLIGTVEQRRHAIVREAVRLGAQHHANLRLAREVDNRLTVCNAMTDLAARRPETKGVVAAQRASFHAAKTTANVRRARAQHERHVDPARERDVRTNARAGGAELHDVAGLQRDGRPRRRFGAVDGERHRRAGDGDRARRPRLEARAHQRAFERCGAVVVADETIRDHERVPIDGAGRRNRVTQMAHATGVLDGRERPGLEDLDHSITRSERWTRPAGSASLSARAVLRLTTSRNFSGRWIGRSAGFAPLRMRSTYSADRRKRSVRSGP